MILPRSLGQLWAKDTGMDTYLDTCGTEGPELHARRQPFFRETIYLIPTNVPVTLIY